MEFGTDQIDHDGVVVDLGALDGDGVLDALAATCRAERRAAAWKLQLAAHWADLHSGDALDDNSSAFPGTEGSIMIGGDGTPRVGEFAAARFAAVAGLSSSAGSRMIAAALDLRHRFPMIWDRVRRAEVEVWLCTKIAADTRALPLEVARRVDRAVAPFLTSLPPVRLFTLVEAKVIEADPEGARARAELAQANRYVRRGRSNELGVMSVTARGLAGDVLQFTAACDRIATILAWQGDADSADIRRSKALAHLANPVRHAQLLAAYQVRETSLSNQDCEPMLIFESDLHPADCDAPEGDSIPEPPAPDQGPWAEDLAADFQELLDRYRVEPRDLFPKTTIYLHLDRDTLLTGNGVVRAEGIGPITPDQVSHWIRNSNLTVTPVIDPDNTPAVDGYEATDRLKDALRVISPAEVFPYGTNTSRTVDHDHAIPYRPPPDGSPGQTSTRNLGRLGRRSHRLKTHGGWQVRIPEPGTAVWRSPDGWYFLANPAGTHPLGNKAYAETLWHAAGMITADLYPPPGEATIKLAG